MRAGRGQHDDLDVLLAHGEIERRVQLIGHVHVLRVALVRPVQADAGDALARLVIEQGIEGREIGCRWCRHGILRFVIADAGGAAARRCLWTETL